MAYERPAIEDGGGVMAYERPAIEKREAVKAVLGQQQQKNFS